ncbi:MAG: Nif3-like dinuclear metal center hexameric protein [Actinobacteria bacterium]|jgi:dinuclear metal center YbgI/SA1388 family protein|nr:MAG: Nif3-like dinuclear metal center hexameric protein [Actinomycetota bacterium]
MACRVGDIIALVEELAPPYLAEDWDNVGLQVGSERAETGAVLVSLDAHPRTLEEARSRGAGMLVCHHPPIFRPLRRLVTDEPVGALLRDALVSGVAVYAAHTNLDASPHGVNAALATLLALRDHRPLPAEPLEAGYKLVTFLPPEHVAEVSAALFETGAGAIGDYAGCSFRVEGTGTFTPGPSSRPARGEASGPNVVSEVRLELLVNREGLEEAVEAMLSRHPYEEPAYDIYRLHGPACAGLGRIGDLPEPVSLGRFARKCAKLLGSPALRLAGDPAAAVSRVAVCGGSGGKLAPRAREDGAQVLVTGDVGYHEAQEAVEAGLAVIDAGHYHTERPVVPHLAALLSGRAERSGLEVEILVSDVHTYPWIDGGAE